MRLGCCSTFEKRKNTLAYGSCYFTLSESLAISGVHGSRNPARGTFGIPLILYLKILKTILRQVKQFKDAKPITR
jgi:hypothetical protein